MAGYKRVSDYAEFKGRSERYHEIVPLEYTERYCSVYRALHRNGRRPLDMKEVVLLLDDYLIRWGGMTRVFGSHSSDELRSNLLRTLAGQTQRMTSLEEKSIDRVSFTDLANIEELFDIVANVRFKSKSGLRTRRLAATATGKMLHMLIPECCVIWDQKVVRDVQGYDDDAKGYRQYIEDKRSELLAVTRNKSIAKIEAEHAGYLRSVGITKPYEPITKMLDEVNYQV